MPVNQADVNTPAAAAVSPEQSKQVEQMVSVLSTNPAFAALAPEVQMTMAAAHSRYQKAA
jgi:predicted fused transcriptional regulator/phosphomethylpyrimidine kinase